MFLVSAFHNARKINSFVFNIKNMKRLFLQIPFLFLVSYSFSQTLSHITLSGGATLSSFSFLTNQKVIIKISPEGKVLEWGTELAPGRLGYYPGKLEPYIDRVTYYGQEVDSAYRGNVKSIGTCYLTYYGSLENKSQIGKIKMIGSVALEYFDNFENQEFRGKLKFVSNQMLSYYTSSENESYRGKLKSVGSTQLSYYSSFDDILIRGKIKSIGPVTYTWYTSFEISRYHGGLKSGTLSQSINGIIYYIR